MRAVTVTLLAILLLFATGPGAAPAAASTIAAFSLFGGTVTQAPTGNVFGAVLGAPITGEIFWPSEPIYPPVPCFAATGCSDADFAITLTLGSVTFPPVPCTPAACTTSPSDAVTLVDGLVTGIDFEFPSQPVSDCTDCAPIPGLTLAGDTFFTTDCAAAAVCGTLDFSNSAVTVTEPPSILLMAGGLLGLALWSRRRRRRFGLWRFPMSAS